MLIMCMILVKMMVFVWQKSKQGKARVGLKEKESDKRRNSLLQWDLNSQCLPASWLQLDLFKLDLDINLPINPRFARLDKVQCNEQ